MEGINDIVYIASSLDLTFESGTRMDTCPMSPYHFTDTRCIRSDRTTRDLGDREGYGIDKFFTDVRRIGRLTRVTVGLLEIEDDFMESGITGTLAESDDRCLHLTHSRARCRYRIHDSETSVIVAVSREDKWVMRKKVFRATLEVLYESLHVPRIGRSDRIGDIRLVRN